MTETAVTQLKTHTRSALDAATVAEAFRITAFERAEDIAIRTGGDLLTITWGLREWVDARTGRFESAACAIQRRPNLPLPDPVACRGTRSPAPSSSSCPEICPELRKSEIT
jgi:hypothetical protein